jgi:hypothetical protein
MKRTNRLGMTLGLALVVVTLAMGCATLLAGSSLAELHMMGELPQQLNARCMADSLLALSMERIANSKGAYGDNTADAASLQWGFGTSNAMLTFSPHSVSPLFGNVPWSTNNVAGDHPVGWLRRLPQGLVQLVAVSQTQDGYASTREAVMFKYPYPYALTTTGPIASNLGLVVGAVRSAADLQTDLSMIASDKTQPCDIASNSAQPFFAMAAQATCHISGDAQACGGILVPPSSVDGAVQSFTQPVPIPALDIAGQEQPAGKLASYLNPVQKQDLNLEGYCEALSGLTETGNIKLDGAMLFVRGDLVVNGSIYGKGAVFATGSITINGGTQASHLSSTDYVAMGAAGDLKLLGTSRQHDFFAGVLYCGGEFVASHLTLQGSIINNGPPDRSGATLTDFQVIAVPDYLQIKFDVLLPPGAGGGGTVSGVSSISGEDPNTGRDTVIATLITEPDGTVVVQPTDPSWAPANAGSNPGDVLATIFGNSGYIMVPPDQAAVGQDFPGPPTQSEAAYLIQLHAAQAAAASPNPPPPPPPWHLGDGGIDHWTIDYNQLIGFGDQLRMLMWRDSGGPWKD